MYFFFIFIENEFGIRKINKQEIVEVQISYQMQKIAMFYLQNCDLWNLFKNYKIFEFFQKKKKTMHRTKKKKKSH